MRAPTFKSYQREQRLHLTEESFKSGMYYTHTPLKEGFSRLLVNFNYKDNGEALIPRSGLRVTELAMLPRYFRTNELPPDTHAGMILCAGKA